MTESTKAIRHSVRRKMAEQLGLIVTENAYDLPLIKRTLKPETQTKLQSLAHLCSQDLGKDVSYVDVLLYLTFGSFTMPESPVTAKFTLEDEREMEATLMKEILS